MYYTIIRYNVMVYTLETSGNQSLPATVGSTRGGKAPEL